MKCGLFSEKENKPIPWHFVPWVSKWCDTNTPFSYALVTEQDEPQIFILPLCTLRQIMRAVKYPPKNLQQNVASRDHQVSTTEIRWCYTPAGCFGGMSEKTSFFLTIEIKCVDFIKCYRDFNCSCVIWSESLKLCFLATN